jgi:predicted amidohydrolase
MREITVAVVQMQPKLGEVSDNLKRMGEFVDAICMAQKADLIVFPELVTTGFECGVGFTELAEKVPGHTVNLLAQQAAQYSTYIVFGMAVKERVESILYNAAIMVGPDGEFVGDYRKLHPRGEERMVFRPGFRMPVLDTSFGPVGLMLGWDLAFPEVARSLALDGAEVICLCASWEHPYLDEWRAMVVARAFENSVYLVAANRIGQEPSYTFAGQSMIVGPRAEVLSAMDPHPTGQTAAQPTGQAAAQPTGQAAAQPEGFVVVKIELDAVRRMREEHQLFQLRQPTTYRSLVRRY